MDERSWLRRQAGELKAAVRRRRKVMRKRLWEFTKWAVSWRSIPLKKAWRGAEGRGLVSLHQRLYLPNVKQIRHDIRSTHRSTMMLGFGRRPILLGPWLSEIGFEVLYWIPFLRWAVAYAELDPERLWVVSRGGTRSWYEGITDQYVEIFDRFSPEQFRKRNEARHRQQGGLKHAAVSEFDREIIDWVATEIGAPKVKVLHPSSMYGLYQHYWRKQASIRFIENFSFYRSIAAAAFPPVENLPADYVVAKFYDNLAMPDGPRARQFAGDMLTRLARKHDVVMLGTPFQADDHAELVDVDATRLIDARPMLSPRDNLETQTRIIANARAYYGTYGGFSYLAPLCGTRATLFHTDRSGFRIDHLELARRVFERLQAPSYLAVDADGFSEYLKDFPTGGEGA